MKQQSEYSREDQIFTNLENFQSIDLEKDWTLTKKRIGFKKTKRFPSLFQVAAILILLLSVGYLSKNYLFDFPEMIVAYSGDEQKDVTLPDGSLVHLNVQSELSYPEKFHRNKRIVTFSGEGFFKIIRDPGLPFLVDIDSKATVEVLGTSFNIESRSANEKINVQVVEGSVAFYSQEEKEQKAILNMGDQAALKMGQIHLSEEPDLNFLSWQTGIMYFKQCPISDVVVQLEAQYKRDIYLDENIPDDLTFTSTIDNQELEDVLEEMSLVLGLITTYNPDTITISKQN